MAHGWSTNPILRNPCSASTAAPTTDPFPCCSAPWRTAWSTSRASTPAWARCCSASGSCWPGSCSSWASVCCPQMGPTFWWQTLEGCCQLAAPRMTWRWVQGPVCWRQGACRPPAQHYSCMLGLQPAVLHCCSAACRSAPTRSSPNPPSPLSSASGWCATQAWPSSQPLHSTPTKPPRRARW